MSDRIGQFSRIEFDEAMSKPAPSRRQIVSVYVIPWPDQLPDDVAKAIEGWEIRFHRLACGHSMGPYLIRIGGEPPSGRITCHVCQKVGLRQGNTKSSTGTSIL